MKKKQEKLLVVAVVLLAVAASAWAIKKRQAGMTTPTTLKSGKTYTVDAAYSDAGY